MYSNYQYAKTLLDLSNKSDAISLMQNQLKSVSYLYNKVPAFRLVFVTKRIDTKKKIEIIKNTLKNFNPLIIEFISILIKNNQTNNLLDITTRFDNMASADSNISNVEITTSEKLNNEEIEYISKAISDKIKIKPKLDVKTDPSIIGGIKLRVGNKIFDNSVSYQIKQLKKTLHNM
tara:strand:+ start:1288 stop:1815 length:528 start_codon:yes stop_codon:yes gene_type:complete